MTQKITYYFLMFLGGLSILVGILSFIKGGDFSAYFFAFFIGIALIGTTHYNKQQKKRK
ncbi:hypothetical protein [Polaribacter sp. WD7]|uniref:hypothetical protein n=1 Tax=Polaribacter sp. WD7 TaxID=2269061 RepID=UPI0015F02692|nr:hypothetical protein [Polaribacter sp. WD7]